MNEYIVINKTILEEKIIELKKEYNEKAIHNDNQWCSIIAGKILSLEHVLVQSTPLIPEIEKAFDAAREFDSIDGIVDINIVLNMPLYDISDLQEKVTKQDYISNLKLNI